MLPSTRRLNCAVRAQRVAATGCLRLLRVSIAFELFLYSDAQLGVRVYGEMEECEGLLAAARSFAAKSGEDKAAAGQRLQQLVLNTTPEAVRANVRALRDDPSVSP